MKQFVSISDYQIVFLPLKFKAITDDPSPFFHFRGKLSRIKTSLTSVNIFIHYLDIILILILLLLLFLLKKKISIA